MGQRPMFAGCCEPLTLSMPLGWRSELALGYALMHASLVFDVASGWALLNASLEFHVVA